jgi:hypothetical protein
MIPHPPPIRDYAITHERRLRFVTSSAFAGNITFQNLLDTLLVATTTIQGADLFSAVRLKFVEVWALPVLGNVSTVQVIYDGNAVGAVGDQRVHTDSSMGIEPAHVRARPGTRTTGAAFQESSTNIAFYLNVPTGSVVDVSLSFKQNLLNGAVIAQNALVGATAGAQYLRGLDGLAVATTKFPPPFQSI